MTSILSGLDFYKLTMSQQAWKVAPDAQVTFTLKNRNAKKQNLLERVSVKALDNALARFSGISTAEWGYLTTLRIFDRDYLEYIYSNPLPRPVVEERDGELHVEVTGAWPLVTFWETIVMSTINDIYFSGHWAGYETAGHNILSEKIRQIRMYHDLRITDFGTRRRFGLDWQETVIRRMSREVPAQFVGTSNPYFAQKFDLKPIGTFAHEMPMVYAALDTSYGMSLAKSHSLMLDDWFATYGYDYSIALTDTFGTDFFFATFGEERARTWKGLRHDSGDPFEFGEKAIAFYEQYGIDPKTKTLVFSDGLDLKKILALHAQFNGRINLMFGWGTGLTNDVELKPLNIVMKATYVKTAFSGQGTVKLSDDEGKHTGHPEDVARYLEMKKAYVNA